MKKQSVLQHLLQCIVYGLIKCYSYIFIYSLQLDLLDQLKVFFSFFNVDSIVNIENKQQQKQEI